MTQTINQKVAEQRIHDMFKELARAIQKETGIVVQTIAFEWLDMPPAIGGTESRTLLATSIQTECFHG